MRNLACHKPTPESLDSINQTIRNELLEAGIFILPNDPKDRGEVPAEFCGRYKGFTFYRAWDYWVVNGMVPLKVAKELYDHPTGAKNVRVMGHCGCPPPEDWATEIETYTGCQVVPDKEWDEVIRVFADYPESIEKWKGTHVLESKAGEKSAFVLSYHINTQEGLNLFMDAVRKYNLNGTPY